jgi:hypothetical protein
LETLEHAAEAFRSKYVHLSTNAPGYTRFNIERWFYLREFAEREGIDRVLHLDSDVMLYAGLTELEACLGDADLSLSGDPERDPLLRSGHSAFFSRQALHEFCSFLMRSYTDPAFLRYAEEGYAAWVAAKGRGGVGDMVLLAHFGNETSLKEVNSQTFALPFDDNFNHAFGMDHNGQHKRIEFLDGLPYVRCQETKRPIRMGTLHFQGPAKRWMSEYFSGPHREGLTELVRHFTLAAEAAAAAPLHSPLSPDADDPARAWADWERQATALRSEKKQLAKQLRQLLQQQKKTAALLEQALRSRWLSLGQTLRMTKTASILCTCIARLRDQPPPPEGSE